MRSLTPDTRLATLYRPVKVQWVYPTLLPNENWYEKILSKSIRKQATTCLEKLILNGITFKKTPLTEERYLNWLKFYTKHMLELGHDIIATPEWYQDKQSVYSDFWLIEYFKENELVGGSILGQTPEKTIAHCFKASDRIELSGDQNISLGSLMELIYLKTSVEDGAKQITSGSSRNGFGYFNSLGYLVSKLRMGFFPKNLEKFGLDQNFEILSPSTPTAWLVMNESHDFSILLYPNQIHFSDELLAYINRSQLPIIDFETS
jgi:hypothetical protein